MAKKQPAVRYRPVPKWTPRSNWKPWDPDVDAGRFEVAIPQPPTKKGDDWTVTVTVVKRRGEGPVVSSLLIEPTWWAINRERANDPEWAVDGEPYEYAVDDPSEVPSGGLTRSRVVQMSWESWRDKAHEWLASLAPEDLKDRGLDLGDVELAAPRKAGSRHKMTDLTKAQVALKYVSAFVAGERTGPAVAEFLKRSEKRAYNLIPQLHREGFLEKLEGTQTGSRLTQKTKDILIAQARAKREEAG